MGVFARAGRAWSSVRGRPRVQCAACGSRFESPRAETGARLRCPLCGAEVEVDELVLERRRVVSQSAQAPALDASRVPRASKRRVVETFSLLLLLVAGLAVLWTLREPIVAAFRTTPAAPGRPR